MRADEAIGRFSLLQPGDRVLCALSGGADSVCLTHFLAKNAERLGVTVAAAHFSHGFRPEDAPAERELCRQLCRRLSIPLFCGEGDGPAFAREHKMGMEEAARALRRDFLLKTAEDWGAGPIATGHHLEDSAETLLLNLIRGSGGAGLAGIPPKAGRWVRPLILTDRRAIEAYLAQNGLTWAEDPTNGSGDNARSVLRRQVFPVLQALNGQAAAHLAQAALDQFQAGREAALLGEQLAALAQTGPEGPCLPIPPLLKAEEETAARALQRLQRQAGGRMLERSHIRALLDLCRKNAPSGQVDLPGSRGVRRGDRLILTALPPTAIPPPETLTVGEEAIFGRWRVKLAERPGPGALPVKREEVYTLRCRLPGDRLPFSYGTKSLKKWLIEKKIPRDLRDDLPILCGRAGIAAVGGLWSPPVKEGEITVYFFCRRNEI